MVQQEKVGSPEEIPRSSIATQLVHVFVILIGITGLLTIKC